MNTESLGRLPTVTWLVTAEDAPEQNTHSGAPSQSFIHCPVYSCEVWQRNCVHVFSTSFVFAKNSKWSYSKTELELSCQRNFLACLMSQNFGMFKTGQDNLSNIVSERTVRRNKKADIMPTILMSTRLKIKNIL